MRPDLEIKKEIAQELIKWLENYDRNIVHEKMIEQLSKVKESCRDDKLSYLLVSERLSEEVENMTYTNSIFENIIKSLQNKRIIKHLLSVDRGKSRILRSVDMSTSGYAKLWLKKPVEQVDINEHNALYSLISFLNDWVKSDKFRSSSIEIQEKILYKFKNEKDEVYGCVYRLDLCSLFRYVDNYKAAVSYLKEVFNNEQELLYTRLQSWIDEINDSPECKSRISYYLESSKHLEFKDNVILKYVNELDSAKSFLLSECKKDLETERQEFNEVLADMANEKHKNRKKEMISNAYYNGYSGSYAQDEMGYSDDDIDTIFDGDPDAYWNID
jgi:hypothetical protein